MKTPKSSKEFQKMFSNMEEHHEYIDQLIKSLERDDLRKILSVNEKIVILENLRELSMSDYGENYFDWRCWYNKEKKSMDKGRVELKNRIIGHDLARAQARHIAITTNPNSLQYMMIELSGFDVNKSGWDLNFIEGEERIKIMCAAKTDLEERTGRKYGFDLSAWRGFLTSEDGLEFEYKSNAFENVDKLVMKAIEDKNTQITLRQLQQKIMTQSN
jgi:hypothetical protein